jgi:hypothetical protein
MHKKRKNIYEELEKWSEAEIILSSLIVIGLVNRDEILHISRIKLWWWLDNHSLFKYNKVNRL